MGLPGARYSSAGIRQLANHTRPSALPTLCFHHLPTELQRYWRDCVIMKFNAVAAAVSAAMLAGVAHAEVVVEESSVAPELPTFTPTSLKADFLEQFTDDWEKRWQPSHAKKDTAGSDKEEEEWAYVGEWAVEEPVKYKGIEGDKGLVVQYEVKLQNGLECGGAYMKLLRDNKALHQEEFSNTTPYVIMFGPDKCGHTNKVHFIFNHKNPKTGEYEEKHLKSPPTAKIVKTTELYTLIVHPNNTYAIRQNGNEVKTGSLLEDFSPAVNPPEEIDDPKDTKPDDWVDQARIPDPEAVKPEDWDEDADGDWIPPTVPNPKCADVSGCGPWSKPMIKNPDYKGKWTAPYVDNPAYKGVWAPRKIKNPDYFNDKTPANFEPMGAIGFEIWTMQNDILFDNIYIGHSVEDAEKLAEETFKVKHPIEKALFDAEKPKKKDSPASPNDLKFLDDPVLYVKEKLDLF